jgi:hypothetical protein
LVAAASFGALAQTPAVPVARPANETFFGTVVPDPYRWLEDVKSPEAAAWLSLVAYVRHVLTEYDELLDQGYDVDSARHFVAADIDATLKRWGVRRRLNADE